MAVVLSRRQVLGGLAATGALAFLPVGLERAASASTRPSVVVGGEEVTPPMVPLLTPPMVPLVTVSPYLSTWLPGTDLLGVWAEHWTGQATPLCGLARVDGRCWQWMGEQQTGIEPMQQTSLVVTATRSVFTLTGGGVSVTAEFAVPRATPGDVDVQALPVALVGVSVASVDGNEHKVDVCLDCSAQMVTLAAGTDPVTFGHWASGAVRGWRFQLAEEQVLVEEDNRARWGSALFAALDAQVTVQAGSAWDVRHGFAGAGRLNGKTVGSGVAVDKSWTTLGLAVELPVVRPGSPGLCRYALGEVREPLVSFGAGSTVASQGAEQLQPWWSTLYADGEVMLGAVLGSWGTLLERCTSFDGQVQAAAERVGISGYPAALAMAVRQTYATTELARGVDGTPWAFYKECSSDGDINTADMLAPSSPFWAWCDPGYLRYLVAPLLAAQVSTEWADSPQWADTWATASSIPSSVHFAAHDLGVYPNSGLPDTSLGPASQASMVDPTAATITMVATWAASVSDAEVAAFLGPYTALIETWAAFLAANLPTPVYQQTCDDYVTGPWGLLTGSTNQAAECTATLAAAVGLLDVLGVDASGYTATASGAVETWSQAARGSSADESAGVEDLGLQIVEGPTGAGTWATLWGAWWDVQLGTNLIPSELATEQAAAYAALIQPYGIPIVPDFDQVRVQDTALLAGWLAAHGHTAIAARLIATTWATWANADPLPWPDRYSTLTGASEGPHNHPLGALFTLVWLTR